MFTESELRTLLRQFDGRPLELLNQFDGLYERVPGSPLVGYAGTYEAADGTEKNWVGELYANYAKAEEYPPVIYDWAQCLLRTLYRTGIEPTAYLGAPEGGKSLADKLALYHCGSVYIYPDVRKITKPGDKRAQKEFYWDRHGLKPGARVVICEDVANNFSTTDLLIELVLKSKCEPVALLCLLNRSPHVDTVYNGKHCSLPVVSLVRKAMPEYKQDDPHVVTDIAAGNIVWKPKDEWDKLLPFIKKV